MTVNQLLDIIRPVSVGYDEHVDNAISLIPEGICCEFGVQDGRTLIPLAEKLAPRTIYGFDSFEGLPEDWCGTCPKGSFKADPNALQLPANAELVIGLYQEALPNFLATTDAPIAFAHLDSDLYSSTKYVLTEIGHRLAKGAILIFDDIIGTEVFHNHVARAVAEWLTETGYDFQVIGMRHRSAAILQINNQG